MSSAGPILTIAIPSYNRCEKLVRLIESLRQPIAHALSEGYRCELLVVLDGSTDASQASLYKMKQQYPCDLRYKWQSNAGLAAARNKLIECARGDRVWFLDDDMTVSQAALEVHRAKPVFDEIIMGPSHVLGSEGLRLFYNSRWQLLAKLGRVESPDQVSFANTSAPRDLLRQFPFDSTFKRYGFEDYDLAIRLLAEGIKFQFSPEADVWHHYDRGPFEMLGNIRDEGINRVKLFEKFPSEGRFALRLEKRRYRGMLAKISNRGLYTPLWVAANMVRGLALTLQFLVSAGKEPKLHGKIFKLVRLANDLALHSGIAQAGGKLG